MASSWSEIFASLTNEMLGVLDLQQRRLQQINTTWTESLGWTEEELLTKNFESLIHPKDLPLIEQALQQTETQGALREHESRWICKTGEYRFIKWNFSIQKNDPHLLYMVGDDVTVLKRDYYLLEQTQKIAHVGGWIYNKKTDDLFWTEEAYRLHGLNPKDFDLTLDKVAAMYTQESRDKMTEASKMLRNEGDFHDLELEFIQPSGKHVIIASHYEPLWEDGEIIGSKGTARDITEIKQIQADLWKTNQLNSAVINSARYAIIATDTNGNVTIFNPAAEAMFGYTLDEIKKKTESLRLLDPEDVLERKAHFEKKHHLCFKTPFDFIVYLADTRSGRHGEWRAYKKDGTKILCDMSLTSIRNPSDQAVAYVAIIKDITQEKQFQEELIKTREKALIATQAKSEFLANMSHEIRTPMNSIMGMAELLLDTPLNAEQKQYLSILERASKSLLDLINDILDLSKIEAGHISLQRVPFLIQDVLDKSVEIFLHKAKEKNITIENHILGGDSHLEIIGDPARLRQVLINLIGNAVKFTEPGGLVRILTSISPERIEIAVKDTGVGMTAEQMAKLFDRFSQGDNSITRKYGGTGLGLHISKLLVERMQGVIIVTSELGKGSTFKVSIPRQLA